MGSTYFADDAARRQVRGVPDHLIPLTELGCQQAEMTGPALKERFGGFDYIYHSGYRRTTETVERILRAYTEEERRAMRVRINPFIRERDPGFTYDMTEAEVEEHFPWLREYWQTCGGFFSYPPGGESLAMVAQRVYLFLNMLFRDRAGEKVLVVSHSGTIRCFRFLLEHWDYEQALAWPPGESPAYCGVTDYSFEPDRERMKLGEYNRVYYRPEITAGNLRFPAAG